MGLLANIRRVYGEGGVEAVLLSVADRIRQTFRDPDFMVEFAEGGEPARPERGSAFMELMQSHQGALVTKWAHYPEIYDAHLSRFRGQPVRFLEIGVFKGGSLELWRNYFGPQATIFGIDINPECAAYDGVMGSVRIGSQADGDFLNAVVDEMGGVDIVLDDGSHNSRHLRKTLSVLFPRLSEGGVYVVEDLHCAYLPRFGGGHRWPWNFITDLTALIDDMHHWYHRGRLRNPNLATNLHAMHCYDSVVVFDKRRSARPVCVVRPVGATLPQ